MTSSSKIALITGITGQDGYYLTELLLRKGYIVHGLKRRSSLINTQRIDRLYEDVHKKDAHLFLHFGDASDSLTTTRLIEEVQPNEIYNLSAQSHVRVSFDIPEYTVDINATGTLRLLESIRAVRMIEKVRYYQASSSEMYGKAAKTPQNEKTPFYPRSPYAVAKVFGYWITVNYREAYDMFATNGILFNHESPLRGETFVTRKVAHAAAQISRGLMDCVYLGNLEAQRDWGHARDYVYGMWLMMQQDKADDYVLATGRTETVRYFVEKAFECVGIGIVWEGKGLEEKGLNGKTGAVIVRIDKRYFRPTELDVLLGDATKARQELGWESRTILEALIDEMVKAELDLIGS